MGFPNGALFWDISHCHECWSIYDGSIFVPRPFRGIVMAKGHEVRFDGNVILEWFWNKVEWKVHFP
jgi:hypothetical protein